MESRFRRTASRWARCPASICDDFGRAAKVAGYGGFTCNPVCLGVAVIEKSLNHRGHRGTQGKPYTGGCDLESGGRDSSGLVWRGVGGKCGAGGGGRWGGGAGAGGG